MELQHSFTVPVPVKEAADVLHDVARLAPCMPGAVLEGFDGEEFTGRMSVKVGAITMSYRGKGRFLPGGAETVGLRVEAAETKGRLTDEDWAAVNKDGDKTLELDEWLIIVRKRFNDADANKDGKLTEAELDAPAGQQLLLLIVK